MQNIIKPPYRAQGPTAIELRSKSYRSYNQCGQNSGPCRLCGGFNQDRLRSGGLVSQSTMLEENLHMTAVGLSKSRCLLDDYHFCK